MIYTSILTVMLLWLLFRTAPAIIKSEFLTGFVDMMRSIITVRDRLNEAYIASQSYENGCKVALVVAIIAAFILVIRAAGEIIDWLI